MDAAASGESGVSGGGVGLAPACEEAGTRRTATPAEMTQYCVCTPMGEGDLDLGVLRPVAFSSEAKDHVYVHVREHGHWPWLLLR